nr:MAG TPA_asm: hypothetical protein [Caudoviricetes sp.]
MPLGKRPAADLCPIRAHLIINPGGAAAFDATGGDKPGNYSTEVMKL